MTRRLLKAGLLAAPVLLVTAVARADFASELGVDPKDAMAQAEAMASNPDAMAMMMRMQANPRVMEAVMDIAMNGEAAAAKYENDEEVLAMMQEMEKLSGQFPGMM